MLIRSQNKQRIFNMDTITHIRADEDNDICVYFQGQFYIIGNYSTREKALKVLDMIEARINEPVYINDIGNGEYAKYFHPSFHMPQDNEV